MRHHLLLLTPLLLAGCVKQSASYYVSDARDHAITVRAEQEYFWDKNITLTLIVARFPDCQRAIPMNKVALDDVVVELFSNGDNVYSIRSGDETKQVEMQDCTQLADPPQNALGEPVSIFRIGEHKERMDVEMLKPATAPAATAPAETAPAEPAPQ